VDAAAGVSAGDIAWPVPEKIPVGNLANYGYENTVLLPVPLEVSTLYKPPVALAGGTPAMDVRLKASWLVCRKECIPEEGEFTLAAAAGLDRAAQGRLRRRRRPRSPSRSPSPAAWRSTATTCRCASKACPPPCRARRWPSSPRPPR
jgi:DsbC/DsbD-like thiol-disulfide interchange protein